MNWCGAESFSRNRASVAVGLGSKSTIPTTTTHVSSSGSAEPVTRTNIERSGSHIFYTLTDHAKKQHTINPSQIVRFSDAEDLPAVICPKCQRVPTPGEEAPVEVCDVCLGESGLPRRSSLIHMADGFAIRLDVTRDQAAAGLMNVIGQFVANQRLAAQQQQPVIIPGRGRLQ